jgi:hypothetical protein
MTDTEDVNYIASDLEKDAVNSTSLAVKELTKLPRIPLAFGGKPTPLRVVLQGADRFQKLPTPPDCGRA